MMHEPIKNRPFDLSDPDEFYEFSQIIKTIFNDRVTYIEVIEERTGNSVFLRNQSSEVGSTINMYYIAYQKESFGLIKPHNQDKDQTPLFAMDLKITFEGIVDKMQRLFNNNVIIREDPSRDRIQEQLLQP